MILRLNSFCQARSKNFSWKLRAYVGICGKIFIINLHNLQILFILWIKNRLSECLAPAQILRPLMEDFLATVLPKPADTGGIPEQLPPNLYVHPKFCCAQKNLF